MQKIFMDDQENVGLLITYLSKEINKEGKKVIRSSFRCQIE